MGHWVQKQVEFTCYTSETIAMPCKLKSVMSHLQNLGSNAKKQPTVTIEDVEDEGMQYDQLQLSDNEKWQEFI